ncbi:MAG: hypothetical protein EBX42_06505 [Betaproteobacteria bacterium]|nr:hypothetical protein [Betaproteobacteria bacterium]
MSDLEEMVRLLKSIDAELKEWRIAFERNEKNKDDVIKELRDVNKNMEYVRGRLTDFNHTLNDIKKSLD